MKKILIILPNTFLGGAEQYLKMVSNYFKEDLVDVCFLKKGELTQWKDIHKNINIHSFSSKNEYLGFLYFIKSNIFSKKIEYDYIFSSHIYINSVVDILLQLNILKTKKFIARESTSIFLRYKGLKLKSYKMAYKLGYNKMNLIICQTDIMKEQLLKNVHSIFQKYNCKSYT